jgi:hypothetical protein
MWLADPDCEREAGDIAPKQKWQEEAHHTQKWNPDQNWWPVKQRQPDQEHFDMLPFHCFSASNIYSAIPLSLISNRLY